MTSNEITERILQLKTEKNAVLLVHNYQIPEIQDIADHLGDSLGLSRIAAKTDAEIIVFCGVMFMAETAKILSPDKKVLLPRLEAGCPMADMANVEDLKKLKTKHPDAKVVTYVNSTAEVKAETDVCCTSANAVQVVQNIEADKIIFAPDKNLASWVQRFTDKKIIPWDGYCYVHEQYTVEEVEAAKAAHPDALIMAHPECPAKVADMADEVLSTSGMVKFAKETDAKKFLIGTEASMIHRLQKENPDKTFLALGKAKFCRGMKTTRLEDVYNALHREQHEITVPQDVMDKASLALEKMISYV